MQSLSSFHKTRHKPSHRPFTYIRIHRDISTLYLFDLLRAAVPAVIWGRQWETGLRHTDIPGSCFSVTVKGGDQWIKKMRLFTSSVIGKVTKCTEETGLNSKQQPRDPFMELMGDWCAVTLFHAVALLRKGYISDGVLMRFQFKVNYTIWECMKNCVMSCNPSQQITQTVTQK